MADFLCCLEEGKDTVFDMSITVFVRVLWSFLSKNVKYPVIV